MKKLIYLLVSLVIMFSLQAQDQERDRVRLQDYLMYDDGEMVRVSDQDRIRLRDQLKLEDGTRVDADGTYQTALGEKLRLRDGECLDMDGNWFRTAAQFREKSQLRLQAMNQERYLMEDGKVYRIKDQQRTQIRERVSLAGAGHLNPDGSYQLRDQQRDRLRDGECLDPDGVHYGSEAQFRNHARLRLEALAQEHFSFQDGKMYRYQNGEQTQITAKYTNRNGLVVDPDGKYQTRNEEQYQLADGDYLDADGNPYASREQFQQQAQLKLQAMNQPHFMFRNGVLYQVRNQEQVRVQEQLALENGVVVNPDGSYRLQNQQQQMLRDGECLDPDGNRYKTQEQLREQKHTQLMAMGEPHFVFQNGQMYRSQNQLHLQMREQLTLDNGILINPDGSYQLKNGRKEALREGQYLDREGKRYESRDRFREKMELRVRDRKDMMEREKIERRRAAGNGKRAIK